MRIKFIYLILLLSTTCIVYSQKILNKKEIYSYWLTTKYGKERSTENINILDSVLISKIDCLKAFGVDTIGLYKLQYIKYGHLNIGAEWDWIAYIQWEKDGSTFSQRIAKSYITEKEKIDSSIIIKYYIDNKNFINNEQIIPVITGVSINEKGDTLIGTEGIGNSKYHTIYCFLGGESKFTRFDQYELDDKNNLFYLDNKNSKINKWLELIQNQTNLIMK